ncbi:MAG: hypothetical protein J3K34DRAFT_265280 [Monoraphidium minutum]|nr:MAG: hypothetical protein J3K34DRAFT_265280 [Monoraphidium minutum]
MARVRAPRPAPHAVRGARAPRMRRGARAARYAPLPGTRRGGGTRAGGVGRQRSVASGIEGVRGGPARPPAALRGGAGRDGGAPAGKMQAPPAAGGPPVGAFRRLWVDEGRPRPAAPQGAAGAALGGTRAPPAAQRPAVAGAGRRGIASKCSCRCDVWSRGQNRRLAPCSVQAGRARAPCVGAPRRAPGPRACNLCTRPAARRRRTAPPPARAGGARGGWWSFGVACPAKKRRGAAARARVGRARGWRRRGETSAGGRGTQVAQRPSCCGEGLNASIARAPNTARLVQTPSAAPRAGLPRAAPGGKCALARRCRVAGRGRPAGRRRGAPSVAAPGQMPRAKRAPALFRAAAGAAPAPGRAAGAAGAACTQWCVVGGDARLAGPNSRGVRVRVCVRISSMRACVCVSAPGDTNAPIKFSAGALAENGAAARFESTRRAAGRRPPRAGRPC